ncbi:hypothetical protein [Leptospira stimsonii]|uniref:Uncharacterized protein n=1 Tax=Leptospira stimsonii TaxID=2202203 RepID=A0ABY2N8U8_9LEPT|nr:hypothetical protein [Leptospira stimsonii]TGK12844.1 hypothetical protein EHO98_19590 [Leptospira stimsonii]TGM18780.1 hypothetical protein EHQ90_06455 [Leptospira stimsonii]
MKDQFPGFSCGGIVSNVEFRPLEFKSLSVAFQSYPSTVPREKYIHYLDGFTKIFYFGNENEYFTFKDAVSDPRPEFKPPRPFSKDWYEELETICEFIAARAV